MPLRLTCLLVLIAISARLQAQTQPTATPASEPATRQQVRLPPGKDHATIQLSRAGPLLLTRGVVNGQDIGWLVVDTGASGLILDPAVADNLKLPTLANARVNGISGTVPATIHLCRTLALGGGEFVLDRPIVAVSAMPGLTHLLGFKLAGLLGGDVLGAAPCAIDFRDDTLTFYQRANFKPPATQPHRVRMIREIPNLRGSVDGRDGWFAIDTGAMLFLELDPAFIVIHRDLIDDKPLMPGMGFGIGGKASDFSTTFSSLRLLGQEWRDRRVSFQQSVTPSGSRDVYAAGRIGVVMMGDDRLTADYASARIWVERRDEPEPLGPYLARIRDRAARDVTRITALMMAADDERADAVAALLADGLDPNAADATGFTPLMYAAANESTECTAALLAHKANPNAEAAFMAYTPLHRAAESGSAQNIDLLLKAGAKPDPLTTSKQTPLLRAAQRGSAAGVAALLAGGADPSLADKTGALPLIEAARQGNLPVIASLLDHHADIEARNDERQTALSTAAYERRVEAVKLLLSRGASARAPYSEALHAAAAANSSACVELLLAAGADVHAKDARGQTALEVAARQGGAAAIHALLDAGAISPPTTRPAN